MTTRSGPCGAAIAAGLLLLFLLVAAPAGAVARSGPARSVPRGFFGVMADGPLTNGLVPLESELRRMHGKGAETVRVVFDWAHAQPYADAGAVPPEQAARFTAVEGVPTDFSEIDRFVAAATAARLKVLPVVLHAPPWAAAVPDTYGAAPRDPAAYARFLRALVRRYGPGGAFWAGRSLRRPIRAWQIWNEPDLPAFWSGTPWAPSYVALLRAARAALHQADRGVTVVSAGMPNGVTGAAWVGLQALYGAGGKGLADAIAVHPYTGRIAGVVETVRRVRQVMRANGQRGPIMLTEIAWSSSAGAGLGGATWDTTEAGQARAARVALRRLAKVRRRLGIAQIDWYTWLSPDVRSAPWHDFAGLNRLSGGRVVAKPALRAYARVARRLEGRTRRAPASVR